MREYFPKKATIEQKKPAFKNDKDELFPDYWKGCSLRRLGYPHGTRGSASPDCSGFALIGDLFLTILVRKLAEYFLTVKYFNVFEKGP
jgi:hypothetical protein